MKRFYSNKDIYLFFLSVYLILLPLNAMNIGAFGSAAKVLAVFPVAVALLYGRRLTLRTPEKWQILYVLIALLSFFWSIDGNATISRAITYIQLFALLITGAMFTYNESELAAIKKALIWSSRITAVVVIMFGVYSDNRLLLDGIIQEDPNYLCAYFSFGIIAALQRVFAGQKRVWAGIELGGYLFLILSTGSRGGLLAICAGLAAFFLVHGQSTVKSIVSKTVLAVLFFLVVSALMNFLPEDIRLRFSVESVVESGGTGRTKIWSDAWTVYTKSTIGRQLFGYGAATIMDMFVLFGYYPKVAHNVFVETLMDLGIIGLTVYVMAIYSFAKEAYKNKDKFSFAVIVCMIVLSLSTSICTFKPYYNIMMYIILSQNVLRQKSEPNV